MAVEVAPEQITNMQEQILRHFTDRIENQQLRITLVELHENDGTKFIRATEAKMNKPDSAKNAAANARYAEMRAHRAAGVAGTTTASWTAFLNKDKDFNDTLTGTPKYEDEDTRAQAYDEIIMEHSANLHMLITVEKNKMQTESMLR